MKKPDKHWHRDREEIETLVRLLLTAITRYEQESNLAVFPTPELRADFVQYVAAKLDWYGVRHGPGE